MKIEFADNLIFSKPPKRNRILMKIEFADSPSDEALLGEDLDLHLNSFLVQKLRQLSRGCVCKVRTKDPENFDEEVLSLVTA